MEIEKPSPLRRAALGGSKGVPVPIVRFNERRKADGKAGGGGGRAAALVSFTPGRVASGGGAKRKPPRRSTVTSVSRMVSKTMRASP